MDREEVLAKIIEFAADISGTDASEITEDSKTDDVVGVTSAKRVAMSASIENEMDVMIPVARFGKFETIGELVDFIMDEI